MFLDVNPNNRACAVLQSFHEAIRLHGLPSRVRGDRGTENGDVQCFMEIHLEDRGVEALLQGEAAITNE